MCAASSHPRLTGITPGMRVLATSAWVERPLDAATLGQVLELMGTPAEAAPRRSSKPASRASTCLRRILKAGKVAILGPMGVGKMVIIQEVIHNLRTRGDDLSLFTFIKPGEAEVALLQGITEEAAQLSLSLAQMIILTADRSA